MQFRFALAALITTAASLTAAADTKAKVPAGVTKLLDTMKTTMIGDGQNHEKIEALVPKGALIDIQNDMMPPATFKYGTPSFGWTGACGWTAVESSIAVSTYPEWMVNGGPDIQPARPWHWINLVVADGAGYAAKAVGLYATNPDKSLENGEFNYIAELQPEPSLPAYVTWLAQPKELAAHLSSDPAVTIYGTSANDKAVGPAAAKKLLASWSKLGLEVVLSDTDHPEKHREITVGDCTAVSARLRMKHQKAFVMLHAFAIVHKLDDSWELVALQYATDRVN